MEVRRRLIPLGLLAVALAIPSGGAALAPIERSFTVTGRVCVPDAEVPVIRDPASGSVSRTAEIVVRGTAGPDRPVSLYRNGLSAGSTVAGADGRWSLPVTLVRGSNALFSQTAESCTSSGVVTVTHQPGPGSPTPTGEPLSPGVDLPIVPPAGSPPGAVLPLPPDAFYLTTQATVVSVEVGDPVTLTGRIHGGRSPYAIRAELDDGETARQEEQSDAFTVSHTYRRPGNYRPLVRVSDAQGRRAAIAYGVVVTGQPAASRPTHDRGGLLRVLLLELLLTLLVFAAWEYHHQRQLRRERS